MISKWICFSKALIESYQLTYWCKYMATMYTIFILELTIGAWEIRLSDWYKDAPNGPCCQNWWNFEALLLPWRLLNIHIVPTLPNVVEGIDSVGFRFFYQCFCLANVVTVWWFTLWVFKCVINRWISVKVINSHFNLLNSKMICMN